MLAMLLNKPGKPLVAVDLPAPECGENQVLLRVLACGVCRTDLHVIDGELDQPKLPLVMGHEIIGRVVQRGAKVTRFSIGDRVGVPWLGKTCGECPFCRSGRENLCDRPLFTGYTLDGGYAELTAADERFCFAIPPQYSDVAAAPLMCAGLIGYRSLAMTGDARRLGIYGFGAAAHLITQIAQYQGRQVWAFTRPGDVESQQFARRLGVYWAGDSTELPPEMLDAAIIYAPVGSLVPAALAATTKGGVVVCAGIHMSDIPQFPYRLLWGERTVRSVANLTRRDGEEFLQLAPRADVRPETKTYPLEQANEALADLRGPAERCGSARAPCEPCCGRVSSRFDRTAACWSRRAARSDHHCAAAASDHARTAGQAATARIAANCTSVCPHQPRRLRNASPLQARLAAIASSRASSGCTSP